MGAIRRYAGEGESEMKSWDRSIGLMLVVLMLLAACGQTAAPSTGSGAAGATAATGGEATSAAGAASTASNAPAASAPATEGASETGAVATTESTPAAGAAATEAAAPAASGEKAKIAMWSNPPESGQQNCYLETVVKPFNAQSKIATIDFVEQPNSWDATRTAISGGAGPDIVVTPGPSFAYELAKAGQLLPLDDVVKQYNWSQTFLPWALDLGKVEGKLYSIPSELETMILYYNKTLFQQKGWQPPKTLDELSALADKIKAAGVIPFGHGNADWRPTNEWFVTEYLNHYAGPQKVYDALSGKAKWDDPDFVQAISMLNDLQQKGYFMGGLDRYYTAKADERHSAFGKGDAAMNIEGTWFLAEIDNYFGEKAGNKNEWDWVAVPNKTAGPAVFDLGIGSTFSINKASKNPQAVAEFLNYAFKPETQATLFAKCGTAPAPVRINSASLQGVDPRAVAMRDAINKASESNNYGYTTWTFWPPKSDAYIYEEIEKVWAKQEDPKTYLQGLQKAFDPELQAKSIPPLPSR